MKVVLKKNWDDLPSGDQVPSQYFTGRVNEVSELSRIIQNKKSGSILIGAPRGAGKTDLVYRVIQIEKSGAGGGKFLPVVLNANQLGETQGVSEENKKQLLISLITRLYATSEESKALTKEAKGRVARLYVQATAKKWEYLEENTELASISSEESSRNEATAKLSNSFNLKPFLDALKVLFPLSLVAILPILNSSLPLWIRISSVVGVGLGYLLVYGLDTSYFATKVKESVNSAKNGKNISTLAKTHYLKDNTAGSLEFELKRLLATLKGLGTKVVFVIDELDKVDNSSEKKFQFVHNFKALFNHSDTLFIFIVDEDAFNFIEEVRKNRNTGFATLFSQRIYINRPTVAEMKEYISKVTHNPGRAAGWEDWWQGLQDFIVYQSRMDYYQISDSIRDCISRFESDQPVIDWTPSELDTRKIHLQKIITALLEEGGYLYTKQTTKWKNERLIDSLYDISSTPSFSVPVDIKAAEEDEIALGLQKDFGDLASTCNLFKKTQEKDSEGRDVYYYTSTGGPGIKLDKLRQRLTFEEELIHTFHDFEDGLVKLYNAWARINNSPSVDTMTPEVEAKAEELISLSREKLLIWRPIVTEYIEQQTHKYNQEEVGQTVSEILSHQAELSHNILSALKKMAEANQSLEAHHFSERKELLDKLPRFQQHIEEFGPASVVIKSLEKGNGLIVVLNPATTVGGSPVRAEIIEELSSIKQFRVFELFTNEESVPNYKDRWVQSGVMRGLMLPNELLRTITAIANKK